MKDNALKGIATMAIAVFLIIVMNTFGKLASPVHGPIEIVFYRNIVGLAIVVAIILASRNMSYFKTTRLKGHLVRGFAGTIGITLVFWAYALMPLADVVAIMFTTGLMTTAASALWLKEKVGVYRWSAVAAGFVGAVIIAAPTGTEWNVLGVSVALIASFTSGAIVSIMLRSLGKTEHALTTAFYFMMIGVIVTVPFVLWKGTLPTEETLSPLFWCGVAGGLSLILKSHAYRYAEASLLSPIHYTSIIWATLIGWAVWGDWPAMNVFIGAGIIIASNIIIMVREKQKRKKIEISKDLDLTV